MCVCVIKIEGDSRANKSPQRQEFVCPVNTYQTAPHQRNADNGKNSLELMIKLCDLFNTHLWGSQKLCVSVSVRIFENIFVVRLEKITQPTSRPPYRPFSLLKPTNWLNMTMPLHAWLYSWSRRCRWRLFPLLFTFGSRTKCTCVSVESIRWKNCQYWY